MRDGKIVIANFWHLYNGVVPASAPVVAGLDSQRFKTICIYLNKNSKIPNYFNQKFSIPDFYISGKKSNIFNIAAVFKLAKVLKENNVDILHCRSHSAIIYAALAAKLADTAVLINQIDSLDDLNAQSISLKNFAVKRCDKVLTAGQSLLQQFLTKHPAIEQSSIFSISNSIDYDKFASSNITKEQMRHDLNLPQDSLVFGSVGKISDGHENYISLFKAFDQTKTQINNAHLVLVGSEKFIESVMPSARDSNYFDSIHFVFKPEDTYRYLKAFDIFVLPAIDGESFPARLLEAMAAGVPCIAPDVGDVPQMFKDEKTGLAFDDSNPENLCKEMIGLATSPHNKVLDMINSAALLVENEHDHTKAVVTLQDIYKNLL